jgi:uncharacterized spore protein YtfJ
MDLNELMQQVRDQVTVSRVFGDPIERDGVTVVPVARVMGGGGGGQGTDDAQQGEGGGFGMVARPAGVYIVRGQQVRYRPAVNVDRLVTTGAVVVVTALLVTALRRGRS